MNLKTESAKQLYRYWELELERDTWQRSVDMAKEQLAQAKYRKREADVALLEYEGSLKAFFDKCSGKFEDKREALAQEASSASAELQNVRQQLDRGQENLDKAEHARQMLPQLEDSGARLDELDPEERKCVLKKETEVYVNRIVPLLQSARESLEEAQQWARPNNRIDTAPGYTEGILLSNAEKTAKDCAVILNKLCSCGMKLEIHPFFDNPSGYINGSARQYGKLDRINGALDAIAWTQRQVKGISPK